MMLFIQRQYEPRARADGPAATSWPRRRTARSGSSSRPGHQPGRHPGGERRRSIADDVRAVFVTDEPTTSGRCRRSWERAPAGRAARRRRVAVPGARRAAQRLPRRPRRAWPPDKREPITVRGPARVRRPTWWERILYNQSVKRLRSCAAGTAAHGRRQRPVPAARTRSRSRSARRRGCDARRSPARRRWYRSGRAERLIFRRSIRRCSH
jgi:hypothetical protein